MIFVVLLKVVAELNYHISCTPLNLTRLNTNEMICKKKNCVIYAQYKYKFMHKTIFIWIEVGG